MDFLNRVDISYATPGRKDNVYLGMFQKVKKYAQKRYLLWTISELRSILNGTKLLASSLTDIFLSHFKKEITFRQLYDVLKRNKTFCT